ncbi:MAG: hypothetical protein QF893_21185 [Alphaproteobacteria bacterium]|jgi:hypothetical protein|nr:hypothetical protein [Alphaproteobacteria bacterium]
MHERYRVVAEVSGGGGAGENVLWEGTLAELRATYGDDPEADPIQSSEVAGHLTVRKVVRRETPDGWEECADPRRS